jgi:sugar/nucleoside kinase (ribokinase family)
MGRFMLRSMAERGIDTDGCRTAPGRATGASVILGNGEDRAILTATGTIGDLRAEDLPDALLRRARHLHVGSVFLQPELADALPELFRRARALGLTTSIDPNWDPSGRWTGLDAILAESDLAFPNAGEVCRLAGTDDPIEAAMALALGAAVGEGRAGRPVVVVKLGAEGAVAVTPAGAVVRVAAPRVTPVDTTGAGDTFDGGFLAAWLDGRDLASALRLAVACGSLSTLAVGGTDGQPTLAEAEAFASRAAS